MELFANAARSTLSSSINNSVTTLTVASATPFPTTGTFRVLIDSELIKVTAVSGTTFTIIRADGGTAAASHSSGAKVTLLITKESINAFRSDNIIRDTYSNLPSPGIAGRLFLPTDDVLGYQDDGSNWNAFGPLNNNLKAPGLISGWTWVNQGSATVTQRGGTISLSDSSQGGAYNWRLLTKATPTPPYTIITGLTLCSGLSGVYAECAVGWRESSSGKFITMRVPTDNGDMNLQLTPWTNVTTPFATYTAGFKINALMIGRAIYIKLQDDNTNRIVSISNNGLDWVQFHSVSRTDFITPDQNIFGLAAWSLDTKANLFSWK